MSACIIPIPAEVELSDGGVNHTPFLNSATPPPPGNGDLPAELSLTFEDGNIADTLYARAFREYQGTPFLDRLTVTNDPRTGQLERQPQSFRTNTWCNGATAGPHEFEVVVADRPFSEEATDEPPYRAVTQGGKFSSTFWTFRCGP